jgi:two-component system, OmpR family, sensor histidine kinase KdpD
MSEFINQHNLGHACQDGIHIHLFKQRPFVIDLTKGDTLELSCNLGGPSTPVRFNDTYHNIFATAPAAYAFAQHAEGLANTGSISKKDLEAPLLLLYLSRLQPVFGRFRLHCQAYNPSMNSRRTLVITRWLIAAGALAGIVLVYKRWLHVNPTTVALSLLLLILVLAAEWGLRYAVVVSISAAACYNFFFLPPYNTFTIADTQNWLALSAFLVTSILASRLSQRVRNEAEDAKTRQRELDTLFRLSRELLQSDSVVSLLSKLPATVSSITGARSGYLYLIEGERLYQHGDVQIGDVEFPHLKHLSESLNRPLLEGDELQIPLRSGVRPKGLLVLRYARLSVETAGAIASLISLALDRAQALEKLARGEAAKENERLRTLMLDSVTHELRTPLTSIKGAATTLLTTEIDSEGRLELLNIIDEESDRLNHLITEAVEVAQLDAQQVQMHMQNLNVLRIVEESIESCSWIKTQHPLNVQIPEGLSVSADPVFLEKVLRNLLENAAKYSAHGTPIGISAEVKDGSTSLSVSDRGNGIDPSEQALIFERFYRGKVHASGIHGTGMGLAISRAIIQSHGGNIVVTSQVGRGSVFTLVLPSY